MTMKEEFHELCDYILALYDYAAAVYIFGSDVVDPDTRKQAGVLFSQEAVTKLAESLNKFWEIIELAETSSTR